MLKVGRQLFWVVVRHSSPVMKELNGATEILRKNNNNKTRTDLFETV